MIIKIQNQIESNSSLTHSKYNSKNNNELAQSPKSRLKQIIYSIFFIFLLYMIFLAISKSLKYNDLNIKGRLLMKELTLLQVEQHDLNEILNNMIQKNKQTENNINNSNKFHSQIKLDKQTLEIIIIEKEKNIQQLNNDLQLIKDKNKALNKERDAIDQTKFNMDELISEYIIRISRLKQSIDKEKNNYDSSARPNTPI